MKFKRGIKNIIYGLFTQMIMLALGLIVPRLFTRSYGSAVNGLFSSLNQLISYISLLEAGLGTATIQALYAPVANDDRDSISSVLSATRIYYRRVSLYYLLCVIALSFIYPFVINTSGITNGLFGMSGPVIIKISVGLITFFAGFAGVVNFYFQATLKQLLAAEGRNYVVANITLIINLLMSAAKIILIVCGADIVTIQFSYLLVHLVQIGLFAIYFRRHYSWVDFKADPDFPALKQRSAFLIHQISQLIFSNTDTLVLSVSGAMGLVYASIYTTYNFVIHSLYKICDSICSSLWFILGQTYHEDRKKYIKLHDTYNTYYITFIFGIMSVCYLLFRPFILLYTKGYDYNYDMPWLPLLFCLVTLLSSSRAVCNNLINIAGHARPTVSHTIIEAAINLGVSLILVFPLGVYGVLIGTIVALLYRVNDILIYVSVKILHRSVYKVYKPLIINFVLFGITVLAERVIRFSFGNYFSFLLWAVILCIIIMPAYFIIISLLSKDEFMFAFNIIKAQFRKKKTVEE